MQGFQMTVVEGVRSADDIEIYESGAEPEFFITHFGRVEVLPGGCVRIYCCSQRDPAHLRVEFSAIVPVDRLIVMANDALRIAAEESNPLFKAVSGAGLAN
jgi:hypothetical protein